MPRGARHVPGGLCYHVLNRGNGRQHVFRDDEDYASFLQALVDATKQVRMRLLAYCLMPNHFHLVVWPHRDGDLSRWMHWLTNAQVRRYRRRHKGSGHLWQGRFKSFPIEQNEHLLTVLRYVERNPLRARLVRRSVNWRWSSAGGEMQIAKWPVDRPRRWRSWVDKPQTPAEEAALRMCIARGRPYGNERWTTRIAARLGTESSIRPRGRPKKS
jgi:putative transposase